MYRFPQNTYHHEIKNYTYPVLLLADFCEKFAHSLQGACTSSSVMKIVLSFDALTRAHYDVTGVTFAVHYDVTMHSKGHDCDVIMGMS